VTYGENQEVVSAALLALIHARSDPAAELGEILQVRRQAHMAVHERLEELGLSRHEPPRLHLNQSIAAARHPLHVLARILDTLPPVRPGSEPPSALLARHEGDVRNPHLAHWRTAARHLTLGNHDLRASADQAWRQPEAAWHLIGDLAITLDAFVLLEQRVATQKQESQMLENRLAAGSVARMANWHATDTSADLTFAAPETTLGRLGGPRIHLVRQPEDFALAQQALAGFLRPRMADIDDAACVDRPGLLAARTVATGQIRLATAFASWAEREGEHDLAQRFQAILPLYADLHRSTLRLSEVQRTASPLVVAQQSEAVQQLRKHHNARVDTQTMHALERATDVVAVTTGRSLRREVQTRRNIVSIAHEDIRVSAVVGTLGSCRRLLAASRALANLTPSAAGAAISPTRRQLAESLAASAP